MMRSAWTSSVAGGPGRVVRMVVGRPSGPGGLVMSLILIAMLLLLAVVVVPLLIVGGVVALGVIGAARTRAWLRGMRAPNGVLDERRNVRVIVRE